MKTIILLLILIPILLFTSALSAQTVNVGGIANPPDVTAALNGYLLTQIAVSAPSLTALTASDTSMTLPPAIASTCVETYSVVTIASASNVSTLGVATLNVPLGTLITISRATTAQYNGTFATTSPASTSSGLTFSLAIANGTYSNASPSTNGYPVLSYNHCTILIDNEAIEINGTANGKSFNIIRGVLGTTVAPHAQDAPLQLLKDTNLRAWYRGNASEITNAIIERVGTSRLRVLDDQIKALNDQREAIKQALRAK